MKHSNILKLKNSVKKLVSLCLASVMITGMTASSFAKENFEIKESSGYVNLEKQAKETLEKLPYNQQIIKESKKDLTFEELVIKNLEFEFKDFDNMDFSITVSENNVKAINIEEKLDNNMNKSTTIVPYAENEKGELVNLFDPVISRAYQESGTGNHCTPYTTGDIVYCTTHTFWERLFHPYSNVFKIYYSDIKYSTNKTSGFSLGYGYLTLLATGYYVDISNAENELDLNENYHTFTDSRSVTKYSPTLNTTYSTGMMMYQNDSNAFWLVNASPRIEDGHSVWINIKLNYTIDGKSKLIDESFDILRV